MHVIIAPILHELPEFSIPNFSSPFHPAKSHHPFPKSCKSIHQPSTEFHPPASHQILHYRYRNSIPSPILIPIVTDISIPSSQTLRSDEFTNFLVKFHHPLSPFLPANHCPQFPCPFSCPVHQSSRPTPTPCDIPPFPSLPPVLQAPSLSNSVKIDFPAEFNSP